jgi:hypothetical protein
MEIIEDKNHIIIGIKGYPNKWPYTDKQEDINILNRQYT